MSWTVLKNLGASITIVLILLPTTGCMGRLHHSQGISNQHNPGQIALETTTTEKDTKQREDRSISREDKEDTFLFGMHHGGTGRHRIWPWLSGGGMILMMVLMVL